MKNKILALILVVFFAAGCEQASSKKDGSEEDSQFRVEILSTSGKPVAGANISGGIDWDAFWAQTNEDGIADLPERARGQNAWIYLSNFFPQGVVLKAPYEYLLIPTEKRLRLIGEVSGWAVKFDPGRLITVDYQGGYHLYSYGDQSVTEIASAQLRPCIKETQLHGNTLWFGTHDDGIYAYSLEDPYKPRRQLHLAIPGYAPMFALKSDIIVVGDDDDAQDSVGVYSYNATGKFGEIARFGDYYLEKIAFLGDYLIVINRYNCLPEVYDLKDPAHPTLVYSSLEPDYNKGILYKSNLTLMPRAEIMANTLEYKLLDLTLPAVPRLAGFFTADSQLIQIIDDRTALGRYATWDGAVCVLRGDIIQGFETVAIVTGDTYRSSHDFEGSFPPYFIISERLYKMED